MPAQRSSEAGQASRGAVRSGGGGPELATPELLPFVVRTAVAPDLAELDTGMDELLLRLLAGLASRALSIHI